MLYSALNRVHQRPPKCTRNGAALCRHNPFPRPQDLTICFAHVAYQLEPIFARRQADPCAAASLPGRSASNTSRPGHPRTWPPACPKRTSCSISGFWHNDLLDVAPRLRFIQSIGAGVDQFDLDALRQRGIRLATASGVNSNAVSEHAMALILAFTRHIHTGRDRQQRHAWRGMIGDLALREDELGGKTLLIIGLGKIGSRLAKLAKAFDMHVLATKRNPATAAAAADAVHHAGGAARPPAASRFRGPHLSADAGHRERDRRRSLRADERKRLPD